MFSPVKLVAFLVFSSAVFAGPSLVRRRELTKISGEKTGDYLVGLKDGKSKEDVLGASAVQQVTKEWKALGGFVVNADDDILDTLLSSEDVTYVEEEGYVSISATQTDAPWGLSRLSTSGPLENKNDSDLTFDYTYDDSAGSGVDVYVIDTGIRVTHEQFGGRASWGAVFGAHTMEDVDGHGTHVAGTVAGSQFGVAKAAHVIAVRIFPDIGDSVASDAISGMDFSLQAARNSSRPSIVSMSLQYNASTAFDDAVKSLTDSGIHVVVAAGNSNKSASLISPARAPEAITVCATDINDTRAFFSNFGPVVDICAPGVNVTSAWFTNDTAANILSGTSMATPHVSGLVAYLIGLDGNVSPVEMSQKVKDISQKGLISGLPNGTLNDLAHNGA